MRSESTRDPSPAPAGPPPGHRPSHVHRALVLLLIASTSIPAIAAATALLTPDTTFGYLAAGALMLCFSLLFVWISSNFWVSLIGAVELARHRKAARARCHAAGESDVPAAAIDPAVRTAIAVPVYNEDPARTAGNVRAILESIEAAGALDLFDLYILSDSTNPDVWVEEEKCWFEIARSPRFMNRVFYRRRTRNEERKSGNIKQFLESWGHDYRYMIVLDADSVMSGSAMVELVRRMEADPECGLIQTWPRIVGGSTLFARMHQYAAGLYGRMLAFGMAKLINPHGNYWGHNAIIRVEAFMQSCGLPHLPGRAPLGGEILSHDFVEAALLVRRDWKVVLAPDIDGSYEEAPPNLIQHLARDQRWCQGNLQHGWLLLARGMRPTSRINFLTGILAYLASPIWLAFVVIAAVMAFSDQNLFSAGLVLVRDEAGGWAVEVDSLESLAAISILGATVCFIIGPKILGALFALFDREEPILRLLPNVVCETVLSILAAPTVMLRHSLFVVKLLFGTGVDWSPQQRDAERVSWRESMNAFAMQTGLALLVLASALAVPSVVHLWLSPILLGLLCSIPFAVWTGRRLSARGWMLRGGIDHRPPAVLRAAVRARREIASAVSGDAMSGLREVLDRPDIHRLHLFVLASQSGLSAGVPGADIAGEIDGAILARARAEPDSLDREERRALLGNASALERLHFERLKMRADIAAEAAGMPPVPVHG